MRSNNQARPAAAIPAAAPTQPAAPTLLDQVLDQTVQRSAQPVLKPGQKIATGHFRVRVNRKFLEGRSEWPWLITNVETGKVFVCTAIEFLGKTWTECTASSGFGCSRTRPALWIETKGPILVTSRRNVL
jgi:hypothetical protein